MTPVGLEEQRWYIWTNIKKEVFTLHRHNWFKLIMNRYKIGILICLLLAFFANASLVAFAEEDEGYCPDGWDKEEIS